MSKYYHTCPLCGANLDPGERCDCELSSETKQVLSVLSPSKVFKDMADKAIEAAMKELNWH